jgi:uncharacterized Tic20 family protein
MENNQSDPTAPESEPRPEPSPEATPEPVPETSPPPIAEPSEVKADNTMGMLCHLLALTAVIGVPLGNILGPLIVWLIKRDDDPFVDSCGKESLNFQISVTIYGVVLFALMLPATILPFFGILLVPLIMLGGMALVIGAIVYTIIAAIKASEGTSYTYPYSLRLIK